MKTYNRRGNTIVLEPPTRASPHGVPGRRGDDLRQGRHRHASPVATGATSRAPGRMGRCRGRRGVRELHWGCVGPRRRHRRAGVPPDRTGAARAVDHPRARSAPVEPHGDRRPGRGARGATGRGQLIAVVDSGIELDHPELRDRIRAGIDCIGTGGDPGRCPRWRSRRRRPRHPRGRHRGGHGPEAGLLRRRVLDEACESGTCWARGRASDVAAGIEWAAAHGADVVNLSLDTVDGSLGGPRLERAVDGVGRPERWSWAAAGQPHGRRDRGAAQPGRHRDRPVGVGSPTTPTARRARRGAWPHPAVRPAPTRPAPTTTDPGCAPPGSVAGTAASAAPRWPHPTWPARSRSSGPWATAPPAVDRLIGSARAIRADGRAGGGCARPSARRAAPRG